MARRSTKKDAVGSTQVGRRTYSVGEAAAILGISRSLAYQCVRSGELPSVRFRSRIVIPAAAVEALLGNQSASG